MIGVFDSGVGGLTVFRALERALPAESLIYLGDTARVPYGTKSVETVERYATEATRFLKQRGVKLLVVACNSASAVALPAVEAEAGLPVLGVIEPGAQRAVACSNSGRIGVIGTRATVDSGAYTRSITKLRPDAQVTARACPLFVPLAEEGWADDEIARAVAWRYLEPLRGAGIDTLVLGCTHYPLLEGVIGEVMGEGVTLVDSAGSVANQTRQVLAEHRDLATATPGRVEHHFFVTDAPGPFQAVAERFLGRPIRSLERARIESR